MTHLGLTHGHIPFALLTARSALAWRGSPQVGITPGEEKDTQEWLRNEQEISPFSRLGTFFGVRKQSSLLSLIPPQFSHHSMTSMSASSWKTEIAATIA